jgi:ligand-binding sensor domain-containing protein
LAFPAFAQTYSYRHYTVEDGLPTNYVYGGLQDSRGYIWFYTEKGVSRFDGYEFRNFTTEDGLPTNDVWQLVEDSQGRMWVGCFGGKFVAIDTLIVDFTEQQSVSKIFTDREGNYWIPTREQGVYLLTAQAKRTKIIKAAGTNTTPALTDLAFSPDGHLYAGSQYGAIYRLEGDIMVEDIPAPSLPLNDLQRVRKLIFTKNGANHHSTSYPSCHFT